MSRREGRCIDCGARIEVVDGVRSKCDCVQTRPETEQEKQFATWLEKMVKQREGKGKHV